MVKPWKVILVFVGVFLAGIVCGVGIGPQVWRLWHPRPPSLGPGERASPGLPGAVRASMLDRLSKQLELTAEQKQKIEPLVKKLEADTKQMRREGLQKFRTAMEKFDAEMTAILTPEQKAKFDESRKKQRERMEKMRAEFRERGPKPGEPGPGPMPGGPEHPDMEHGPMDHGPGDLPPLPPPDEKEKGDEK